MDTYSIIKADAVCAQFDFRQSKVSSRFKDDLLEVNSYKLVKGTSLTIEPTKTGAAVKTYFVFSGSCYNAETESVLSAGDVIVVRNPEEYINLLMLEPTEILEHGFNISSFEVVDDNVAKLLEILDRIQQKDSYTDEHCVRVFHLVSRIGLMLRYKGYRFYNLRRAARYHDIGKIFIGDGVLLKPESLSDIEFLEMKNHVNMGKDLIDDIFSDEIFAILSQHHERIDGSGYPNGLIGDAITEEGRILAICDSYDAMITDRIYKKGKTRDEAIAELREMSGKKYDGKLVEVFVAVLESGYME